MTVEEMKEKGMEVVTELDIQHMNDGDMKLGGYSYILDIPEDQIDNIK